MEHLNLCIIILKSMLTDVMLLSVCSDILAGFPILIQVGSCLHPFVKLPHCKDITYWHLDPFVIIVMYIDGAGIHTIKLVSLIILV